MLASIGHFGDLADLARLHYDETTAEGEPCCATILLLHGIYGSGQNWRSVARRLVGRRPEWRVVAVDLCSHGRSPRLEPQTLRACAEDLAEVEARLGDDVRAVLGHSFGGKVALLHASLAGSDPSAGPRQYWIVDAAPGARRQVGGPWRILEALRRSPGPFDRRVDAQAAFEAEGFPRAVARWMATNVAPVRNRRDGQMEWRIDPEEMERHLDDFAGTDLWNVVESPPAGTTIHFVRATDSAALTPADVRRIELVARRSGRVSLHHVPGGHWLNVENPDGLVKLLARELPKRM